MPSDAENDRLAYRPPVAVMIVLCVLVGLVLAALANAVLD